MERKWERYLRGAGEAGVEEKRGELGKQRPTRAHVRGRGGKLGARRSRQLHKQRLERP